MCFRFELNIAIWIHWYTDFINLNTKWLTFGFLFLFLFSLLYFANWYSSKSMNFETIALRRTAGKLPTCIWWKVWNQNFTVLFIDAPFFKGKHFRFESYDSEHGFWGKWQNLIFLYTKKLAIILVSGSSCVVGILSF